MTEPMLGSPNRQTDMRECAKDVEILQIIPAERSSAVYRSGSKRIISCWALVRSKKTGEAYVTALVSGLEGQDGARLELAGAFADVEKFVSF